MNKEGFVKENAERIYLHTLEFMFGLKDKTGNSLVVDDVKGNSFVASISTPAGMQVYEIGCPGDTEEGIELAIRNWFIMEFFASSNPIIKVAADMDRMMGQYGWLDIDLSFANVIVLQVIEGSIAKRINAKDLQFTPTDILTDVVTALGVSELIVKVTERQMMVAKSVAANRSRKRH